MYKDFGLLRRRRKNMMVAMRINPPRVPKVAPTITGTLVDRELPTLPEGRVIVRSGKLQLNYQRLFQFE